MDKQTFTHIVDTPENLSKEQTTALQSLTETFPYCQVAHILLAKAYRQQGNMLSDKMIKRAATYAVNRSHLKAFILKRSQPIVDETESKKEAIELDTVKDAPTVESKTDVEQADVVPKVTQAKEEPANKTTEQSAETTVPAKTVLEERPKTPKEEQRDELITELEERLAKLQAVKRRALESAKKQSAKEESINQNKPQGKKAEKPVESKPPEESVKKETPTAKKSEDKKGTQAKKKPTKKKDEKKTVDKKEIKSPKKHVYSSRLGSIEEQSQEKSTEPESEADILLAYLDGQKAQKKKVAKDKDALDIIDSFIEADPVIKTTKKAPKQTSHTNDLARDSSLENTELATENLAKINVRQGNITKAILIYEQLMLKFPDKTAYFASQIEKLKKK